MTSEKVTQKYHSLKLKLLTTQFLTEKEQGFVAFYSNCVLKYGLSHEERDLASQQALLLYNSLNFEKE